MPNRYWTLSPAGSAHRLAEWSHDAMKLEQVLCPPIPVISEGESV